jgi:acetyl-CoA acetyltransferase
LQAIDDKRFWEETVPVPVKTRKAETLLEVDEGPRRDTSLEELARLKPAFVEGGSVTAGNSSSLNDGAAAVLLVSADFARAHDLEPLARIRSLATAGVPPRVMGIGPVSATTKALERAGASLNDVGLVELNEAFAAQILAVLYEWGDGPGRRAPQPQRRGHRPRPSAGVLWGPHPDHAPARDEAPA